MPEATLKLTATENLTEVFARIAQAVDGLNARLDSLATERTALREDFAEPIAVTLDISPALAALADLRRALDAIPDRTVKTVEIRTVHTDATRHRLAEDLADDIRRGSSPLNTVLP